MDGKEAIIAKIIEEANATSKQIVATAESTLAYALDQTKAEAEEKANRRKVAVEQECEAIVSRALTLARLEGRKNSLSKKQEVLKSVYAEAKAKLLADKDGYKKFYASVLLKSAEDDDVVSVGTADDILDAKWLKSVKSTLTMSDEKHDGRGIILRGKKADKNLTVDAIINATKDETESEVAKILFGE